MLPRAIAKCDDVFATITADYKKKLAHSSARIARTNARYNGRRIKKAKEAGEHGDKKDQAAE